MATFVVLQIDSAKMGTKIKKQYPNGAGNHLLRFIEKGTVNGNGTTTNNWRGDTECLRQKMGSAQQSPFTRYPSSYREHVNHQKFSFLNKIKTQNITTKYIENTMYLKWQ